MTRAELVETWRRSVSVMHIAHHVSAARYANWHLGLGAAATALAAIVGASIFATLTKIATDAGPIAIVGLGLVSMLSAALTGAAAFLKLDERAARHGKTAADFQGLRREMDEEFVRLAEGRSSNDYSAFKTRWYEVLKAAPPLPQSIHDRVKREIDTKHKE